MKQNIKFTQENIFYNPATTSSLKIGLSNIIALIFAIIATILIASISIMVNTNIVITTIIASLITVGYALLTTKVFEKIFK